MREGGRSVSWEVYWECLVRAVRRQVSALSGRDAVRFDSPATQELPGLFWPVAVGRSWSTIQSRVSL